MLSTFASRSRGSISVLHSAWTVGGSRTVTIDAGAIPNPEEVDPDGSILTTAITAIDSFHSITGLPWWASIAAMGMGIRVAMLPVSLKGMKASAALFPLMRQARDDIQSENSTTTGLDRNVRKEGSNISNWARLYRRFHELRKERAAPHPFWIVGSPLIQFPVFFTSMASIRTMSVNGWPGFSTGGAAWFPDLTQSAVDLASLTAPMGPHGIILPLTISLAMYLNIDAAFSVPTRKTGSSLSQANASPATFLWIMGKVRLALEWAVIPLFVISLQLPQGALCYWGTSSVFALTQSHLLKSPSVRAAMGLPGIANTDGAAVSPRSRSLPQQQQNRIFISDKKDKKGSGGARPAPAVLQGTNQDEETLAHRFAVAAEHQATGRGAAAAAALRDILESHPNHPRALFAMGQVLSGLKDWTSAAESYLAATRYEESESQRCRAWFGAGVALHMKGDDGDAIEAFMRAAEDPMAGDMLRVRAWVAAAQLEVARGRVSDAAKLLKEAAQIEPKVEDVYLKPLMKGKDA